MKYVFPILLIMLVLSLCGCSSLTNEEKALLKEWPISRLNELYNEANALTLQILEPAIVYFDFTPGPDIGLNDDYIGALEYLRDHDMSVEIAEVEAILETLQSMPDSPRTKATWAILEQRLMTINSLTPQIEALKALNELGQSYKDKEINGITRLSPTGKEFMGLPLNEERVICLIPSWYKTITM